MMGDYRETQEWRDTPHRNKNEEIVIRFIIEYHDEDHYSVKSVFAEIFRSASPLEYLRIGHLNFDQNVRFHHVFSHNRTIHGWLRWRTGLHVSSGQQIVGRVETGNSGDIDYWNYDGFMIGFGALHPSPTPDIPKPSPDVPLPPPHFADTLVVTDTQLDMTELFPFIYIQPWPKLASDVVNQRFMSAPADVANTAFYKTLASATGQKKQQEAVAFIDGATSPTSGSSYAGQFLRPEAPLPSPFSEFMAFPSTLRRECTVDGLNHWIHETFESWNGIKEALETPPAQTTLTNIWNSVIALTVTAGYDHVWLSTLIRLLQVTHLVDGVLALREEADASEEGPAFSSQQLTRMIRAVLVLPDDIFPVFPPPEPSDQPAIQPYAVGAIRTVHYTPGRYTLGDVQRIEIVTAGETRQEVRRNLRYADASSDERSATDTAAKSIFDTTTADLVDQVQKTLSDRKSATTVNNYQTDYGAPSTNTMTVTGNWWVQDQPAGGYSKDISKFARDVIERSVKTLRQKSIHRHKLRIHEETEITETRTLSNTEAKSDRQTVFRWVNREFRLETTSCQDRLVFEFFIDNPGSNLLQAIAKHCNMKMVAPVSPETLGIKSYKDISPDARNTAPATGSVYYLDAFEAYGIAPDGCVPSAIRSVTTGLMSRSPLADTRLEIPQGYFVLNATATVTSVSKPQQVQVTVGGVDLPSVQTGTLSTFKGDLSAVPVRHADHIWASVLCLSSQTVPPSGTADTTTAQDPSPDAETFYAFNLQLQCARSLATLSDWQLETYRKIQTAYRQALAHYNEIIDERRKMLAARNPRLLADIVQDQIVRSTIALFASTTRAELPGATASRELEPRYVNFLRNAFDWEGMAVELLQDAQGSDLYLDDGQSALIALFSSEDYLLDFLNARQARLMLSVKPDFARTLLMAFRTGELWPCEEDITPCTIADMNIVDLLLEQRTTPPRRTEDCWTITVPTDMVALSKQDPFL